MGRIKVNDIKEIIVKFNNIKNWCFVNISTAHKLLVRVTEMKREKNKISKLEMKKERLQETVQKYKLLQ